MVGLGVPSNLQIRGRSVLPILRDRSAPWDDTLFGQYDMHHYKVARMRMIRTQEWKLIRHFEPDGQDEYYHLVKDPGETRNLAASAEPEHLIQRDELAKRLQSWMNRIGDTLKGPPGL